MLVTLVTIFSLFLLPRSKLILFSFSRRIAKSLDEKVFDAKLCLYDHTEQAKAANVRLVDVGLDVNMGRIEFVFLMKFVNDVLAFIEPFSGAKEMVAEKADIGNVQIPVRI